MTNNKHTISNFKLELFILGELPAMEHAEVQERLRDDAALRERLRGVERSNEEILAAYPSAIIAEQIAEGVRQSKRRATVGRRSLFVAAPLLAGALALAAIIGLPEGGRDIGVLPGEPGIRLKGEPQIMLHRMRTDAQEMLSPRAVARAGDVIQLSYRGAGYRYGCVFSIDGRGVVTRHLPERDANAAPLESGTMSALPHAYELDDAPHFERFFFVAAMEPFSVEEILDAAKALKESIGDPRSRLPVAESFWQQSFFLRKAPQ